MWMLLVPRPRARVCYTRYELRWWKGSFRGESRRSSDCLSKAPSTVAVACTSSFAVCCLLMLRLAPFCTSALCGFDSAVYVRSFYAATVLQKHPRRFLLGPSSLSPWCRFKFVNLRTIPCTCLSLVYAGVGVGWRRWRS